MVLDEGTQEFRTRHISIKAHRLIADHKRGTVQMIYSPTKLQLADGFTKALGGDDLKNAVASWGLVSMRTLSNNILVEKTS
eukprot:1489421-Amphidinium_carterae.1